mmetsp:Transcript_64106/g.151687  ORF Transcript_64106/g.151687 Transcript_64106/m.151687 type:complete len:307 (-) Transcript_64106:31-951(-)
MRSGVVPVLFLLLAAASAHDGMPINPKTGVSGFPDCVQTDSSPGREESAAMTLSCAQKQKDHDSQISIGCVGDSITAGVHSSGPTHTWPAQLQQLLGDKYKVTNLGACGSTMLKQGNSPYWQRPQYKALTAAKWDIVVIMLGTNDAKDPGSHGPDNWPHNCTGAEALSCPFAQDYASMINLIRTLGTTAAGPEIYVAIPPPLMALDAYGMNQTVINDVFPTLIPAINAANKLPNPAIDVFTAMGGASKSQFPKGGCTLQTESVAGCKYFCDSQSCDQCHPNDDGYKLLAATMQRGMGLPLAAASLE